jgi:hypothetical protein
MLGGIQANPDNRHGTAPLAELSKTSQPGTFDAAGGRPPQHQASRMIPQSRFGRPRPVSKTLPAKAEIDGSTD